MMETKKVQRRQFLTSSAMAGAGLLILPSGSLMGANAPSNKLNIGLIGAYGRARSHYGFMKNENVVAICDISEKNMAEAAKTFPKAKQYFDWRKLLDERKDLDATVICTTDFTHAHAANWSLNRGLHVYCEKPLGNCVNEARVVRANYLRQKNKIATQHGTQRHAKPNFNRLREWVIDGAIGELQAAYAWGNRQLRRPGYLPAAGQPPKDIHYDLWLGPICNPHPYNPDYFSARPGANCLQWNMYWDFGSGQVGDMGSHTMDLVWNAIDADLPTSAEGEGEKFNSEVTPVELHAKFAIPANAWRGEIDVHWYQGGMMPKNPAKFIDLNKIGHGAMFKGTHGFIIADFDNRALYPYGKNPDLSYYKKRSNDDLIPDMGGFQDQWVKAVKGDLKTSCDFDYGGTLVETMALGLVAYQAGKKINYDGAKGRVTNSAEADALLSRPYRDGWPLDG